MPESPPVLSVSHLSKSFRDLTAVHDVSFAVAPGEIVGLVGPNGAGKTTTINMVLGVLAPTSGAVRIDGVDLAQNRSLALQRTNFAAVYAPLPGNLTVEQNLRVFGMIYAVPNLRQRIEDLLTTYDLKRYRATKAGVLSSGEQTRLGLAKAMLNRPRLLLLDEPTASIDPSSARDIRAGIAAFVAGNKAACCGPATTCTRCRRCATACCSCRTAGSCSKAIPRRCPRPHGAASLDDLFVAVAHEALHEEAAS